MSRPFGRPGYVPENGPGEDFSDLILLIRGLGPLYKEVLFYWGSLMGIGLECWRLNLRIDLGEISEISGSRSRGYAGSDGISHLSCDRGN